MKHTHDSKTRCAWRPPLPLLAIVLASLLLGACASPRPRPQTQPTTQSSAQLNHGYALLSDLLSSDKDVDKILFIKRVTPETKEIIQEIAQTCATAAKDLAAMAKEDPRLRLANPSLPAMETATREAISKFEGQQLLTTAGEPFELSILLTQVEATNYGRFLAQTLAGADANAKRSAWLKSLAARFAGLHARAVARLGVRQ